MYLNLIFLLLFLLSKEFLVFNEELLILFSFSLFFYLALTFGSSFLTLELNKQSSFIKDKLLDYKNLQKSIFNNLSSYYQQQSFLFSDIKEQYLTANKLTSIILKNSYIFLKRSIISQIEKKFKRLFSIIMKTKSIFHKLFSFITLELFFLVLNQLQKKVRLTLFRKSLHLCLMLRK